MNPFTILKRTRPKIKRECRTCEFSEREGYDDALCKRNAPLAKDEGWRGITPKWPKMKGDDWCGDYQLKGEVK